MHRRWLANRTNAEYLAYLSKAASISPVFAQILINRGIRTVSDVHDFLHPGLTGLSDPFDLPGMREAIDRIKSARQRGERVLHGDYDADGLTATAITASALRTAGIDTAYFIPHRMRDGYGFNAAGVEAAQRTGAQLVITVDWASNYPPFRKGSRNENQTTSCILSDFDFPDRLSIHHSYTYPINRNINSNFR